MPLSTQIYLDYHSLNANKKGEIQVIFGPMFSGKTTELIRRMKRYEIAKHKCLIVKYANDNRYNEMDVVTHDRQSLSAIKAMKLMDLRDKASSFDVIGIDEGQFFPDVCDFCEDMANEGKVIIVAALDGTFQRVGFGSILELVPLAETVIKLKAVCMICCKDASYTKRISSEKKVELIGGVDKYMAVCRECYFCPSPVKWSPSKRSPAKQSPFKESPAKRIAASPLKNSNDNMQVVNSAIRNIIFDKN